MARSSGQGAVRRARSLLVAIVGVVLLSVAGGSVVVPRLVPRPAAVASSLPPDAMAALSSSRGAMEDLRALTPPGYSAPATTSAAATPAVAADPAVAPVPAPAVRSSAAPPAPAGPPGRQGVSALPTGTAASPGGALPLPVSVGTSTQVVTVVAPSAGSTTARLQAWQRTAGGWKSVLGPVSARVGSAGVGSASETGTRTPAGTFSLTEAFGRLADPGTALPYRVIDRQDWWVSDATSPSYNRHVRCQAGRCPFDEAAGENLWSEGIVYNEAVVIDVNRAGVPGAGSAYFLHVTNGASTAGCVAIEQAALTALLRWLDPSASPLIAIGVS